MLKIVIPQLLLLLLIAPAGAALTGCLPQSEQPEPAAMEGEGGAPPPSELETLASASPATPTEEAPPDEAPEEDAPAAILFLVPQITFAEEGNPLSEPVVTGFEERRIAAGESWVVAPGPWGQRFEQAVGALRLELVEIQETAVVVNVLADRLADGTFQPRPEPERRQLSSGDCIEGHPLMLDALYSYCFVIERSGGEVRVTYALESESTMPRPPAP